MPKLWGRRLGKPPKQIAFRREAISPPQTARQHLTQLWRPRQSGWFGLEAAILMVNPHPTRNGHGQMVPRSLPHPIQTPRLRHGVHSAKGALSPIKTTSHVWCWITLAFATGDVIGPVRIGATCASFRRRHRPRCPCRAPPPSPPPPTPSPPPPVPRAVLQPRQCVTTADGVSRCIQIQEGLSLDDERVQAMMERRFASRSPSQPQPSPSVE